MGPRFKEFNAVCFSYGYTRRRMTFECKGITHPREACPSGERQHNVYHQIRKKIMTTETIYTPYEPTSGHCRACGEESYEILIGDGRCLDCIEDEKFFKETMKGL